VNFFRRDHQHIGRIDITHHDVPVVQILDFFQNGNAEFNSIPSLPVGERLEENWLNEHTALKLFTLCNRHKIAYELLLCIVNCSNWETNAITLKLEFEHLSDLFLLQSSNVLFFIDFGYVV